MKTQKKLTIFILLLTFMFVLPFIRINKEVVSASSNLQVMKNSSGNDMTYRNSSEKVYGLKEYDYPTAEYRAVWVSTFVSDIPKYTTEAKFKSDATYLLDDIVSMGMNAIVFHVRTHNNALYNSSISVFVFLPLKYLNSFSVLLISENFSALFINFVIGFSIILDAKITITREITRKEIEIIKNIVFPLLIAVSKIFISTLSK